MDLLIKKATIIHPNSKLNRKVRDIKIKDGIIEKIGRGLTSRAKVIEMSDLHVSVGWMDIGTQIGEPGYEFRETIRSVSKAAALGGFTAIAPFPNTLPVVDNKADIGYLKERFTSRPVSVFPIAAVSVGAQGKEMAELLDLARAGAVAFSDGCHAIDNDKLILLALQYLKRMEGLLIDNASGVSIAPSATINEGKVSAMLGLKGLPAVSEQIRVYRNIALTEYTESRCLIHNISSSHSIPLLRKAKQKGLDVYASVPVLNLAYTEEENKHFDTNWKVFPPLRTGRDRASLLQALQSGIIDIVVSNHVPVEIEGKAVEFPYADFGAIGLQTLFPVLRKATKSKVPLDDLISILAYNPRKALGLRVPLLEEGSPAEITLFRPNSPWIFEEKHIASLSKNSPLIGQTFPGHVLGTFHKNNLHL